MCLTRTKMTQEHALGMFNLNMHEGCLIHFDILSRFSSERVKYAFGIIDSAHIE